MIKVGILFDAPIEYSGGLNYFRNLLYALSLVNDDSVRPYIFFTYDVSDNIVAEFSPLATVVRTKLLQRRTMLWFANKLFSNIFGSMFLINVLLKSHGINVLSHIWFHYKGRIQIPIIGWIPDFQSLHLPQLFPENFPAKERKENQRIISQCDIIILSSNNALRDFNEIAESKYQHRGRVLQFVSQPDTRGLTHGISRENLEKKYVINGQYFFLPNQFWAHKNHMVVLDSVRILKEAGINILVVCTGNTQDYRIDGTRYIDSIHAYIKTHGLNENIKILGLIDYEDVLSLMRNSLAVINPSYFEGWSSSVEEAKSMGKAVILSKIDVHIEQNPINGRYFDPDNAVELSQILSDFWMVSTDASFDVDDDVAGALLRERTLYFGQSYLELLKSV